MDKLDSLSINEIKILLHNTEDLTKLKQLLKVLESDSRKGVTNLVERYKRIISSNEQLYEKYESMCKYENDLYDQGAKFIAGVDEVGRGPLAGPVVTCAVILPRDAKIIGVDDSKKLSEDKRIDLSEKIKKSALAYSIDLQDSDVIDDINILQATLLSMKSCVNALSLKTDYLLVDAVKIPDINIDQVSIIKGDTLSVSIAAASILAKVFRDNLMKEYHKEYPMYDFINNKGYGSKAHIDAIKKYGICKIHRKKFVEKFI